MIDWQITYVEWLDAAGGAGWVKKDELQYHASHRVYTLGFVVRETKSEVAVASSIASAGDSGEQYNDPIHIPKRSILKRTAITAIEGGNDGHTRRALSRKGRG